MCVTVAFINFYLDILCLHLKLVNRPLLVTGTKPIYETGPVYKSFVYFDLYRQNQQYFLFMLIKLGNAFVFALSFVKIKSLISRKMQNYEDQNIRPFYKSSRRMKTQTTSFGCILFCTSFTFNSLMYLNTALVALLWES